MTPHAARRRRAGTRTVMPPRARKRLIQALRFLPIDHERRPGVCRVYGPDGSLRAVLDPLTRLPIAGSA